MTYKGKAAKPSYDFECQRCGRALSNPVSVSRGIGPICERRIGIIREARRQAQLEQQVLRTARDQAINRILQKLEVSAVMHQPHLALAIEGVRQAYNHRDYLYDVCRELSSARPVEEKIEKLKERTTQEVKAEVAGYLVTGARMRSPCTCVDWDSSTNRLGRKGPCWTKGPQDCSKTSLRVLWLN